MVVLVVVAALTLAACSTNDPKYRPGTLPPLSPTPTAVASSSASPSPTGTRGMADKDQVRVVYLGFVRHYQQAEDQPAGRRRAFLSQWMTDPGLASMTKAIDQQVAQHRHSSGRFRPNIMSIKVSGSTAIVDDCLDQRHFHMKDTRTGKVVGGGSDFLWAVVTLKKAAEGWRVSNPSYRNKTCVP
ncbi:MAG TPA: hypothetical protein VF053_10090 [Streptosporangiales bacterium]